MLERFTGRARRAVVLAQEQARTLNHNYIGTEHILLGLIHEGEGGAAKVLLSLGISLDSVRQQVEEIIGRGQQPPSGHIPFSDRAKKVLELSLREALQLGHDRIGTEHILLGLIREGEGVAARVLVQLGADLKRVRQQATRLLHDFEGKEPAAAPPAPPEPRKLPTEPAAAPPEPRKLPKEPTTAPPRPPEPRKLRQRPPGTVQMTLAGVRVDKLSNQPIVLLKEVSGDRYLPIWTGPAEATSIAFAQEGRKPAKPLTHDLLCDVLETMGIQLLNATISTLTDGVFDSYLSLSNHRTVSARPSDAIALAIRTGAPILAGAGLLDATGVSLTDDVPEEDLRRGRDLACRLHLAGQGDLA